MWHTRIIGTLLMPYAASDVMILDHSLIVVFIFESPAGSLLFHDALESLWMDHSARPLPLGCTNEGRR